MQDFKNKVAVVTGAASGIGKALALRCAGEGMLLALADVEAVSLGQFESELRTRGSSVFAQAVDISKPASVDQFAADVYKHFGAVHLLCNNAGVLPPGAPVWSESLSVWHWTLDVNFFGVLHGLRAFVPRMLEVGEEAHIVNTASFAGLTTRPLMSAYNVSKHAVVALSECLYSELQLTTDKVHVSVLCPAFARTKLAESARNKPHDVNVDPAASFGFFEALKHVVEQGTPPEEIAVAVFTAIRENRFWILTHPQLDGNIRDRFQSILSRTNPPVRDLRSQQTPLK